MSENKVEKAEKTNKQAEERKRSSAEHDNLSNPVQSPEYIPGDEFAGLSQEGLREMLLNSGSDVERSNLALKLQTTHGNAFVQRLLDRRTIQAKLTVSQPDDPFEIEADRVAEEVTQTSSRGLQRQESLEEENPVQAKISRLQPKILYRAEPEEEEIQMKSSGVQRKDSPEEEDLLQAKITEVQREAVPEEEEIMAKSSYVQRDGLEEEDLLQAKASDSVPEADDRLEKRIDSARSSGGLLSDSVRRSLEPAFGVDFAEVRVHTNSEADRLSRQLKAEAFTTGKDIFFREGRYQPGSDDGKRLIAHELTHVVQQGGISKTSVRRVMRTPVDQEEARARIDEQLDIMKATIMENSTSYYNLFDSRQLLKMAAASQEQFSTMYGPRQMGANASNLIRIHNLLVERLALAPTDNRGNPVVTGLPPGTKTIGKISPFEKLPEWQTIATGVKESEQAEQKPGRGRGGASAVSQKRAAAPLPPLPAEPVEMKEWQSVNKPPVEGAKPGQGAKAETPGSNDISRAKAALDSTTMGAIQAAILARVREIEKERGRLQKNIVPGTTPPEKLNQPISQHTSRILYFATRLYVLDTGGKVEQSEDFSFEMDWTAMPGAGAYLAFPYNVPGGREGFVLLAKLDGGAKLVSGDFKPKYVLKGFIPLQQLLHADFSQGKGVLIYLSPSVFFGRPGSGLHPRIQADWWKVGVALRRSKKFVLPAIKSQLLRMKEDPAGAASDIAFGMAMEKIAKVAPVVGQILNAYQLMQLAAWLGTIASIAVYSITEDEVDIAAQAIALRIAEEVVQEAVMDTAKGVKFGAQKGIKAARGKPGGPEIKSETGVPEETAPKEKIKEESPAIKQPVEAKPGAVPIKRPSSTGEAAPGHVGEPSTSETTAKGRSGTRGKPGAEAVVSSTHPGAAAAGPTILSQKEFDAAAVAGKWGKYIKGLKPEERIAADAKRMELIPWLKRKLGLSDEDMIPTGTRTPASDVDVQCMGHRAEEIVRKSYKAIAERFGISESQVDSVLDIHFLPDPTRAHIYTDPRLSRAARKRLRKQQVLESRMRYLEALATKRRVEDTPMIKQEFEQKASEWGIDTSTVKGKEPMTHDQIKEVKTLIDQKIKEFNETVMVDPKKAEVLANDIMKLSYEVNVRNPDAYYDPFSIESTVTAKQMGRPKRARGLGEIHADLLQERSESLRKIADKQKEMKDILAKAAEMKDDSSRRLLLQEAAKKYELSKSFYRSFEKAQEAGLNIDKDLVATAKKIYEEKGKDLDKILTTNEEMSAYVNDALAIQNVLIKEIDMKIQSPVRSFHEASVFIRQQFAIHEKTIDKIISSATTIYGASVSFGVRELLLEMQRKKQEEKRMGTAVPSK